MDILITGGAGFIGSHLIEALIADGHTVTAIDDLSTGSLANLASVKDHPNLTVHIGAAEDRKLLDPAMEKADFAFHLAAAVGVKKILDFPIDSMQRNVRLTEIVLESSHKYKTPILVASTSEVYGKSRSALFSEDHDLVLGPTRILRWSYACAKLIDEFLAMAYHKELGQDVIITRFFNTVGPRQSPDYGMVIPRLMKQAIRGEDLTIFGDGSQARCFCHVLDVVPALVALMNNREKANGNVYNIGNDEEVSILELAHKIIDLTGGRSKIRYVPIEEVYANKGTFQDIPRRKPDLQRIRNLIGYEPKLSLEQILEEVREEHARIFADEKAAA